MHTTEGLRVRLPKEPGLPVPVQFQPTAIQVCEVTLLCASAKCANTADTNVPLDCCPQHPSLLQGQYLMTVCWLLRRKETVYWQNFNRTCDPSYLVILGEAAPSIPSVIRMSEWSRFLGFGLSEISSYSVSSRANLSSSASSASWQTHHAPNQKYSENIWDGSIQYNQYTYFKDNSRSLGFHPLPWPLWPPTRGQTPWGSSRPWPRTEKRHTTHLKSWGDFGNLVISCQFVV